MPEQKNNDIKTIPQLSPKAKTALSQNTLPKFGNKVIKEIKETAEQGDEDAINIVTKFAEQQQPWALHCLGKIHQNNGNYKEAITCFSTEECCTKQSGFICLGRIFMDRIIPNKFRVEAFEACLTIAKNTGNSKGIAVLDAMLKGDINILPQKLYTEASTWANNQYILNKISERELRRS